MKKIFLLIIFVFVTVFNFTFGTEKARGFFVSFGVGPRIPISNFANSTDLGYGLNIEFSYTDNEVIPFFLFSKIGYEQYPGSQNFYAATDYSNFSTTAVPVNLGLRYYFSPLIESAFLLIPIVETSATFGYIKELHQFKVSSGRNNFFKENYKFGFSGGIGISMFIMEILASYNYFNDNQFLSADLKIRLPLFVIF